MNADDVCNVVFVGKVHKFINFDKPVDLTCAISFDAAWKPVYWYESYDDNLGPLNSKMLLVYPKGFITVNVSWGPEKFTSKEELANFVASTMKLELISGQKTGMQIDKISNFNHNERIDVDLYNKVMTTMVNNLFFHTTVSVADLTKRGDIPEWFMPIFMDRLRYMRPLIITQEEIDKHDY